MINLLLLSNFYPVMSYRRVQKKKRNQQIIVYDSVARYSPQEVNLLRWNLSQNCNISSVLSIFEYNQGKANDKFITSQ